MARREEAEEEEDIATADNDDRSARTGARTGARRALAATALLDDAEEGEDAMRTAEEAAVGRTEQAEAIIFWFWLWLVFEEAKKR